jgi:release factor glutamine methyltransferase
MSLVSFCGLTFDTHPGQVMTPRPASERLVEAALEWIGGRPARVVDVGTGAGSLAVAIATAAPLARVFATDTSRCSVALAKANVRRHRLAGRVRVLQGDLLEPVPGPVDLVVANLPYLPDADADRYPELAVEPASAVFAPGDGLDPYRRLLSSCADRLADDGGVVIQLHRRTLAATRRELPELHARLELYGRAWSQVPLPVAA